MSKKSNKPNSGKNPFVSIVMITYNSEKTIEKCLSSVFEVNYPRDRYEVIVVDAGSVDRTLEIIKKFTVDKTIVKDGVLRGEARNIGVQESKGDIVAMVDSDMAPSNEDWLAKVVKEFNDPNVAFVMGRDRTPLPSEDMSFIQKILFYYLIKFPP